MKKTVRTIFGAVACLALLGTAVSCNHDIDADDPFVTPSNNNQNENGNGNGNGNSDTSAETGKTYTTIELTKNTYAATAQTQVKLETGFTSLKAGDKVQLTMKGTASAAFGSAEIIICDTTEAAGYWKNLAEPYACSFDTTDFDISTEFTLTDAPVGTGDASMTLAINGLAGDTTVTLTFTEFKLTKNGGASASEQEPTEDPAEEPAADYGLLDEAFNTLGWGTAVRIDAAKFANAAAGSKIIVTYEMNEDGQAGYHMFQLWNTAVDTDHVQFKEVAGLTEAGTYTHTLTADEATLVKANGLAIQGNSVTITKVELEAGEAPADEPAEAPADIPAADTTVWTGSTDLAWGARAPEVALADKEFTGLKITYTTTADAGLCFKLLDTSWGAFELTSVTGDGSLRAADASDDPLKAVDLTSGKTDGVVTVTFADAAAVKTGLGFQGAPGVTITKIELVTE